MQETFKFQRLGEMVAMTVLNDDVEVSVFAWQCNHINIVPHHSDANLLVLSSNMDDESSHDYTIDYSRIVYPTATSRNAMIKRLTGFFSTEGAAMRKFAKFCRNAGNINATGNYATNTEFLFEANSLGAEASVDITALVVTLQDTAGGMDSGSYGDGITLANGIGIELEVNGVRIDMLDGQRIKANIDFASHCFSVNLIDFGTGAEAIQSIAKFSELFGSGIRLNAATNDKIVFKLQDNFTALLKHTFKIVGVYT